jgi:short-subunit dehydrogenase
MQTSNMMKAPFMDARTVAEKGYRAMLKERRTVITGKLNWVVAQATRFAPRTWTAAIARKLQEARRP